MVKTYRLLDETVTTKCQLEITEHKTWKKDIVGPCGSNRMTWEGKKLPCCRSHLKGWLELIGPFKAAEFGFLPSNSYTNHLIYNINQEISVELELSHFKASSYSLKGLKQDVEHLDVVADFLDLRGAQRAANYLREYISDTRTRMKEHER